MPQFCLHCNGEVTDDSVRCLRCGQPREVGAVQDPQAKSDRRLPFWTLLPWTLLAAVALFFLPHLLRSSEAEKSAPVTTSQTLPAPVAPVLSAVPSAPVPVDPAEVPLTVTLSTASGKKHVPVGTPVMVSMYASLPPGQSAILAISYTKDNGPKALLALAQGTLAGAAWVPTAPGRYQFTASALDSRRNSAFSHHLILIADAPPISAPAKQAPPKQAPPKLTAGKPPVPNRTLARLSVPKPPLKAAAVAMPHVKILTFSQPHHAQPYHVAAASFRVKRIAAALAGALRQRGFHAFVRPSGNGQYQVETGDFVHRADADKQVQLLKRDGYPSYLFQAH